jgi:predicted anti-sigma-YlaC factor YlaD
VDCTQTLEQLEEYLDEPARAELCRAIEEHLKRCQDCKVYVDTVRKTIVLYQNDREMEVPANANSRLQAALAQEYARAASATHD